MGTRKLILKSLIIIITLFPVYASAQETLIAEGSGNNLYLKHKAAPKENFYSVGRLYNISPKDIFPVNNLTAESGMTIGQIIKIPLTTENFVQTNSAGPEEATVPVFYKVAGKETLYQLKTRFNNVPVASLKLWNNLAGNILTPGQDIIIGFLKVKKGISTLAQKGIDIPADDNTAKINQATVKQNPFPPKTVIQVKDPLKTIDRTGTPSDMSGGNSKDVNSGVFKSLYGNTGREETGIAGVFKSMSGWDDKKYYCLHNSAPQGTVIKITNISTGKYIYAKVLDIMPDLKQNSELTVRLSNAAADALGGGMSNFNCTINY